MLHCNAFTQNPAKLCVSGPSWLCRGSKEMRLELSPGAATSSSVHLWYAAASHCTSLKLWHTTGAWWCTFQRVTAPWHVTALQSQSMKSWHHAGRQKPEWEA